MKSNAGRVTASKTAVVDLKDRSTKQGIRAVDYLRRSGRGRQARSQPTARPLYRDFATKIPSLQGLSLTANHFISIILSLHSIFHSSHYFISP